MGRSRRNKNRRKHLRTKRKNKRQIVQRGGYYPEYGKEPLEIHPRIHTMLKSMASSCFPNITPFNTIYGAGHSIGPPGTSVMYLSGYNDFIGDHTLLPLENSIAKWYGKDTRRPQLMKQVYYYLSPFVREYFIISKPELVSSSMSWSWNIGGSSPVIAQYIPYGRDRGELEHFDKEIHGEKKHIFRVKQYEKNEEYWCSFLFFPNYDVVVPNVDPIPTIPGTPRPTIPGTSRSKRYIAYDFIPDSDKPQVKHVEGIGDVILQKPPKDQPWTGELIRILFEPDFVPPPIDDIGFSPETFVQVGQALLEEGNEKTP